MATRVTHGQHQVGKHAKVMSPSVAAKQASAGVDQGKPGKNFNKIAQKAAAGYGSAAAGQKVAGAVYQNMRKHGKL